MKTEKASPLTRAVQNLASLSELNLITATENSVGYESIQLASQDWVLINSNGNEEYHWEWISSASMAAFQWIWINLSTTGYMWNPIGQGKNRLAMQNSLGCG